MCFTTFEKQKKAFLEYKIKKLKTRKMGIYPCFWSNIGNFSTFYFLQKRPGKCVLQYSKKKRNTFLDDKNKKFIKSKNWDFSKGVSMWFLLKIGNFSIFFFGKINQENVFLDILKT